MSQAVLSQSVYDEVQVSGGLCFRNGRWRQALLYYLFGVWRNSHDVMHRPKISFAGAVLRLNQSTATYYAYQEGSETITGEPPKVPPDQSLTVGNSQVEVEQALIRFVKNDRIRLLTIKLDQGDVGRFFLWKKRRRGQLGVLAEGVLDLMEMVVSHDERLFE